ncbi:MAG: hypothetical protein RR333_07870, partial [Bacteroidales bacterium]
NKVAVPEGAAGIPPFWSYITRLYCYCLKVCILNFKERQQEKREKGKDKRQRPEPEAGTDHSPVAQLVRALH